MFSRKKLLEILLILNVNSTNMVKLAVKLAKVRSISLHSSVFGKVRELVGQIKYAFASPCIAPEI